MRKTILAAALAISMSGCASVPTSVEIDARISQIQSLTSSICKFVPTASTVASIIGVLTGSGPIVTLISDAANSICGAVTAKGLRRGAGGPTFRGVAIHGQFVR